MVTILWALAKRYTLANIDVVVTAISRLCRLTSRTSTRYLKVGDMLNRGQGCLEKTSYLSPYRWLLVTCCIDSHLRVARAGWKRVFKTSHGFSVDAKGNWKAVGYLSFFFCPANKGKKLEYPESLAAEGNLPEESHESSHVSFARSATCVIAMDNQRRPALS